MFCLFFVLSLSLLSWTNCHTLDKWSCLEWFTLVLHITDTYSHNSKWIDPMLVKNEQFDRYSISFWEVLPKFTPIFCCWWGQSSSFCLFFPTLKAFFNCLLCLTEGGGIRGLKDDYIINLTAVLLTKQKGKRGEKYRAIRISLTAKQHCVFFKTVVQDTEERSHTSACA